MNSTRFSKIHKIEMIEMSAKGMSVSDIAKHFKRDPKTIRMWLKRWQTEKSIDCKPRSGRPRKLTCEKEMQIIARIQTQRNITAFQLKKEFDIFVSERTITNFLNKNGYNSYIAPKCPFHFPEHLKHRLGFANQLQHWTFENWKNVIFTDEKTFINHQVTKKKFGSEKVKRYMFNIRKPKQQKRFLLTFGVQLLQKASFG